MLASRSPGWKPFAGLSISTLPCSVLGGDLPGSPALWLQVGFNQQNLQERERVS